MAAGALAFAAVGAIIANALLLQSGHHPSPMFGAVTAPMASQNPLPRPRPAEAGLKSSDAAPEAKPGELKASDIRAADPLTNLVKATTAPAPANVLRPPAPIPGHNDVLASNGSRRVAAVQRVLTEYGYGQLKATGTVGSDTQAAIQKFERDRKIPITGQMSERLVHELVAMTGHPID
jgi:hypothetical protein